MAAICGTSFEELTDGQSIANLDLFTQVSGAVASNAYAHAGAISAKAAPGEWFGIDPFSPSQEVVPTTLYLDFRFRVAANPSPDDESVFDLERFGGAPSHALWLTTAGKLAWAYDGGGAPSYIDTGGTSVTTGAFNRAEVKLVIDASVGGMEVKLNGVTQFSNFTEDTASAGTAISLYFGPYWGGDQEIYYDSLRVRTDRYPSEVDEHLIWDSDGETLDDFRRVDTAVLSTDHVDSGTYAVKVPAGDWIDSGYFPVQTTLYARFRVYIPALPSIEVSVVEGNAGASEDRLNLRVKTDGKLTWEIDSLGPVATSSVTVVTGAFNTFELKYVIHASSGGLEVTLNDVLAFSSLASNTSAEIPLNNLLFGPWQGGGQDFYYDSIEIRDAPFPTAVSMHDRVDLSWLGSLLARDRLPVTWQSSIIQVETHDRIPAIWGTGLRRRDRAPFSSGRLIARRDQLPLEWAGFPADELFIHWTVDSTPTWFQALPVRWLVHGTVSPATSEFLPITWNVARPVADLQVVWTVVPADLFDASQKDQQRPVSVATLT